MPEVFSQLHTLLVEVILPQLQGIQASQAEQRLQTERLNRNLQEFRTEMQARFAELRAEIAACRQEIEDALITLRDNDAVDYPEDIPLNKKRLIH